MVNLSPGQSVTETATATYQDASGNTFIDTAAVITYADTVGAGAITITDHGTVAGVSTYTAEYAAAGTASVVATATDPDGHTVSIGTNNPTPFTCAPAVANTDATAVNVVDGTPA
jgi:hypothetical protein